MKYTFLFFCALFCALSAQAQSVTVVSGGMTKASFTVNGNCEMCKATIEGVAKASGAASADWNMKTDQLTIQFDPKKVTLERIQRNIAAMGYDNDRFKGNDEAYGRLPEGCQYVRKAKEE
jgi:periplasmic mercuric ion binding protein